jgi:hypothetical protein
LLHFYLRVTHLSNAVAAAVAAVFAVLSGPSGLVKFEQLPLALDRANVVIRLEANRTPQFSLSCLYAFGLLPLHDCSHAIHMNAVVKEISIAFEYHDSCVLDRFLTQCTFKRSEFKSARPLPKERFLHPLGLNKDEFVGCGAHLLFRLFI